MDQIGGYGIGIGGGRHDQRYHGHAGRSTQGAKRAGTMVIHKENHNKAPLFNL